ncbi:MAG: hypothetical protein JO209_07985 [Acidisphaera sp.]|nr:hypothetical protein [Acidisphaera sp.]
MSTYRLPRPELLAGAILQPLSLSVDGSFYPELFPSRRSASPASVSAGSSARCSAAA